MEEGDARGIGRAAAFVCDDSTRVVSTGDTLSQVATPGCDTERRRAHRALTETNASGGAYEKNNGRQCFGSSSLAGARFGIFRYSVARETPRARAAAETLPPYCASVAAIAWAATSCSRVPCCEAEAAREVEAEAEVGSASTAAAAAAAGCS